MNVVLSLIALAVDDPPGGPLDYFRWISSAGGLSVAVACGWLVYTGRLAIKREVEQRDKLILETAADRDEWKDMALTLLRSTERMATATERAVGTAEVAVSTAAQIVRSK